MTSSYARLAPPPFQVLFSRFASPHVNIRLDSAPVSAAVALLGADGSAGAVLMATGNKITKIPLIGPGCGQLTTCTSCLLSSRVTECGWCAGRCSRAAQCPAPALWTQDYCTPVITKVTGQRHVITEPLHSLS
ncbi:Hepatocyte growth factor receptor [Liparis tanakae]|uniref:Hepatocyte growth factor receptor n=1 Tax=Liparis tanakae TaxID=230148 RepID=A0A4Z2DZ40_9TELE|nr:Hepatocyte growth factor receptor [Liparis tanakae]